MREMITNIEVQEFLTDFEQASQTIILEEGKEKDEIIEIAKAKGINLVKNTDLAGFKTVFMFANKANNNGARAPKQKLLKALPTMIGKPMDIDHVRNLVVGHYIDYRFRSKDNAVIAYGVFYKSNFGKEWEKAKQLLKANKLGTSFEIWCPQNKRKRLSDGTYELTEMEIAGGGLMFKEKPAYEDAKVLEMAKAHINEAKDLIFASEQYKAEDMIRADYFKEEVLKNKAKLDAEKQAIADAEAQKRAEELAIKCGHCNRDFEKPSEGEIKCPSCFSILKSDGVVLYPPQIIDFKLSCPQCRVTNWKLIKSREENSDIKCMSCSKEYTVDFAKPEKNEFLDKINFVYTSRVSCPQCSQGIPISGVSNAKNHNVSCSKCGLKFSVDTEKIERYKSIDKISELVPEPVKENDSEGKEEKDQMTEETKNNEEVKKEEVKVDTTNKEVEKEETKDKVENTEEKAEVETPKEEVVTEEKVETVEKSSENKVEEVSEVTTQTPPEESKEVVSETPQDNSSTKKEPEAQDETKVEENISQETLEKATEDLKKLRKLLDRAVAKIVSMKKTHTLTKASIEKTTNEELEKVKTDAEAKIELYKANAKTIIERQAELGVYAKDLSEKDILNDDKFARIKAEKENAELKAKLETSSDVISTKTTKDEKDYKKIQDEINDKAFNFKKQN